MCPFQLSFVFLHLLVSFAQFNKADSKRFDSWRIRTKEECEARCNRLNGYYVNDAGKLRPVATGNIRLKIKCLCSQTKEFSDLVRLRYGKFKGYESYAKILVDCGLSTRNKLGLITFKTVDEYEAAQKGISSGSNPSGDSPVRSPSDKVYAASPVWSPKKPGHRKSRGIPVGDGAKLIPAGTTILRASGKTREEAMAKINDQLEKLKADNPKVEWETFELTPEQKAEYLRVQAEEQARKKDKIHILRAQGLTIEDAQAKIHEQYAKLKSDNPNSEFEVTELTPEQIAEILQQPRT